LSLPQKGHNIFTTFDTLHVLT